MKKYLLLIFILLAVNSAVNAQTLRAKAIDEISTAYPKNSVRIEIAKNINLYGLELKKGYIVTGTLTDVKSPNRSREEASFTFTLVKYKDLSGNEYEVKKEIKTVYNKKHIKFMENFLREADFSFSPIANMNSYGNDTDITGRPSPNYMSIKPLSIAENLMPNEYKEDMSCEVGYKTGLSDEGEDILILPGDKIKFKFPD